jgi:hypothetical protein
VNVQTAQFQLRFFSENYYLNFCTFYSKILVNQKKKGGILMKRNLFKIETSRDYTNWDLNCRHVVAHTRARNKLERIFKRKNRRKIKKLLTNYEK